MPRIFPLKPNFTAGEFGPRLAARVDFAKYANAAETMENFWPLVQGGMDTRPGTKYVATVRDPNNTPRLLPFLFSVDAAYIIEAGPSYFRFFRDRAPVMAEDVDATITNGTFASDISGWDDLSTGGASIAHDSTNERLSLVGAAGETAHAEQDVATSDTGTAHTLAFTTYGGPVKLRIGTTSGGAEIVDDVELGVGHHVYTFTPGASPFYVQFLHETQFTRQIDDVAIQSDVPIELTTPYANPTDLRELQFAQSADVLFIAHDDYAPRQLERRGDGSWSLVEIEFVDGPYRVENDTDITITPSGTTGSITLTASASLFWAGHVGSLWRLKHSGIVKTASAGAEDTFTAAVKVEGSGTERTLSVAISGTWSGTVHLQRSYDGGTTWVDYKSYTANTEADVRDELSQTVHYRLGIKTGNYGSGTAELSLTYAGGETWGYCQITAVNSATSADATVKEPFAEATATTGWREGSWSAYRGYPAAVALYQQRLCWGGTASQLQTLWASASDDLTNFAPGVEDADAFEFTIAAQEVNVIRSLVSAQFLWALTSGGEWIARATTQDEPLTPTNIQIKQQTTRGAARIQPVLVDRALIYVQRFANKVYEELFTFESDGYVAFDMTEVAEHIAGPGFVEVAYQREPTPRLFFVRSDGEVSVLTYRREQEVFAWSRIHPRSGDAIQSVAVIPGATQDEVWFVVRRAVNGNTTRYIEYLAPEDFGADQADAYFVDAGITYDGAATTTISGLDHLEGETVQVLADGASHPDRVVSGGQIMLERSASVVHVGLPYISIYRSLKFEGGNPAGTAIGQIKRPWKVTLSLLRSLGGNIGPTRNNLEPIEYRTVGDDMDAPPPLFTGEKLINFRGGHDLDPRIVIVRDQPLPLTVLAMAVHLQVNPK